MRKEVQTVTDRRTAVWLKAMEIGARAGCHQLPERSFFFREWQFPVCARCTGVMIGHLLSVFTIKRRLPTFLPICLCLTTLADWTAQQKGVMSNNRRRLITGILGGFGTGCLYFRLISALSCQRLQG